MKVTKNIIGAFCLSALMALSSCGANQTDVNGKAEKNTQDGSSQPAPTVSTAADAAKAELPALLVARVPVGADGQELNDQAETREAGAVAEMSDASLAAAFDGGVKVGLDELDADTSVQQHYGNHHGRHHGGRNWYWNTPWYPGKALGRGLWWGRNPYVYYGGYSYPYSYRSYYYYNGCNYYYYNRYY